MELSYTVTVLHICVHKYTKGLRTKHKHKKENVKTASLKKASQLHRCNTLMLRKYNQCNWCTEHTAQGAYCPSSLQLYSYLGVKEIFQRKCTRFGQHGNHGAQSGVVFAMLEQGIARLCSVSCFCCALCQAFLPGSVTGCRLSAEPVSRAQNKHVTHKVHLGANEQTSTAYISLYF